MGRKRMKKIERSMILAVCIFVMVFSLGTGAIIAIQYRQDELTRLAKQANAYADAAAKIIKGDSVAYYLETMEKDHYYNQVLSYLEAVVEHTNVEYFYVFVPGEDHATYVWDADNAYTEEGWELGHIEPYEAEEKQQIISALDQIENHDKDGEVFVSNGEFGYLATSYAPLYTGDGRGGRDAGGCYHRHHLFHDTVWRFCFGGSGYLNGDLSVLYQEEDRKAHPDTSCGYAGYDTESG